MDGLSTLLVTTPEGLFTLSSSDTTAWTAKSATVTGVMSPFLIWLELMPDTSELSCHSPRTSRHTLQALNGSTTARQQHLQFLKTVETEEAKNLR